MPKSSVIDNLLAADVLLYRSNTLIGKAIRLLDDAEVSHAGLLVETDTVGEALTKGGLQRRPLAKGIEESEWVAVRRLANPPPTMQPVLKVANDYLDKGERYAYGQILLLAGICLLRRTDGHSSIVRRLAKAAIDKAAAFVNWCQSNGKQPMICSEFVYRCYDQAVEGDNDPYTIEVTEFRTSEARLRLLGRRRRQKAVATSTTIPPDSLLGRIQVEYGDIKEAVESRKVRAAAPSAPISDDELDSILEAFLAETSGGAPKSKERAFAARPEVTMDDLRCSVADFAAAIHETSKTIAKMGSEALGVTSMKPAAMASETLQGFSADFVTPGDLFRSPSLVAIGILQP
jgi:hypothetical protein